MTIYGYFCKDHLCWPLHVRCKGQFFINLIRKYYSFFLSFRPCILILQSQTIMTQCLRIILMAKAQYLADKCTRPLSWKSFLYYIIFDTFLTKNMQLFEAKDWVYRRNIPRNYHSNYIIYVLGRKLWMGFREYAR